MPISSIELRRRAYLEAATVLRIAMDGVDLPGDLSESEEEEMRLFIAETIARELDNKAEGIASFERALERSQNAGR